jgi:hypothetical protein
LQTTPQSISAESAEELTYNFEIAKANIEQSSGQQSFAAESPAEPPTAIKAALPNFELSNIVESAVELTFGTEASQRSIAQSFSAESAEELTYIFEVAKSNIEQSSGEQSVAAESPAEPLTAIKAALPIIEQSNIAESAVELPSVNEAAVEPTFVTEASQHSTAQSISAQSAEERTYIFEIAKSNIEQSSGEQSCAAAESAVELTCVTEASQHSTAQSISAESAEELTHFFEVAKSNNEQSAEEQSSAAGSPAEPPTSIKAALPNIEHSNIAESAAEPAIVPGTAATRDGVSQALRLARCAKVGDPPDELAMDYLCEFLLDPHWIFAPLAVAAGAEEVRAHFISCADLGLDIIECTCRYLKMHDCHPGSVADYDQGMVTCRRKLTDSVNLAAAKSLSGLQVAPKARALGRTPKLKALSKRR